MMIYSPSVCMTYCFFCGTQMKFMHMPLFLVADIGSTVSLAEVRRHFLSGSRRYRGALCVRILHKSRLMYYGKADQKCECPYKVRGQIQDTLSHAKIC